MDNVSDSHVLFGFQNDTLARNGYKATFAREFVSNVMPW